MRSSGILTLIYSVGCGRLDPTIQSINTTQTSTHVEKTNYTSHSLKTNVTDIPVTTPLLINKQPPTHKSLHQNLRNHVLPKNKTLQGKNADTVYSEPGTILPNSDLEQQSYILVKTLFHGPQER